MFGGLCRRLWWLCHAQHDSCESCLSRAKITILAVLLQRTVALAIQLVSSLVMSPSRRRDWLTAHVHYKRQSATWETSQAACDGRRLSCVITYRVHLRMYPRKALFLALRLSHFGRFDCDFLLSAFIAQVVCLAFPPSAVRVFRLYRNAVPTSWS